MVGLLTTPAVVVVDLSTLASVSAAVAVVCVAVGIGLMLYRRHVAANERWSVMARRRNTVERITGYRFFDNNDEGVPVREPLYADGFAGATEMLFGDGRWRMHPVEHLRPISETQASVLARKLCGGRVVDLRAEPVFDDVELNYEDPYVPSRHSLAPKSPPWLGDASASTEETGSGVIRPGMTTEEINAAGLAVDLPFEAPTSDDIEYDDGLTLLEAHPELLEPDLGGPEE